MASMALLDWLRRITGREPSGGAAASSGVVFVPPGDDARDTNARDGGSGDGGGNGGAGGGNGGSGGGNGGGS